MSRPTCPWCNSKHSYFHLELFEPVGPNLYNRFTEYQCSACLRTFVAGDDVLVNSNNEPVTNERN